MNKTIEDIITRRGVKMKRILTMVCAGVFAICVSAQTISERKVYYNEKIDPIAQIDSAVAVAKAENKYVVCQVGGSPGTRVTRDRYR